MGRRRLSPRLRANRSNARKSTGPRTLSGKEISSMNAIVHGLSAKRVSASCNPEVDRIARQLCGSDKSETAFYLALEIAEAQFELNAVRAYKMILRHLHAAGKDSPLPVTDLLDDTCLQEFFEYMLTGEPEFWFGPREKDDWRLFEKQKKLIFRIAKTSRKPALQIEKLHRYEQLAIQKRQISIAKWDAYKASRLIQKTA